MPRTLSTPAMRIGEYELFDEMGAGAFGTVYRGKSVTTACTVAVKAVRLSGATDKAKMMREVDVMQALPRHANVMRLVDAQTVRDGLYMIFEYCAGGDLAHVIREHGPQPEGRTRDCVRQLAAGVALLHDSGLVHRDLKPQNVLLSSAWPRGPADGLVPNLKVADFGLARSLLQDDVASTVCGTPLYMAPEVLGGEAYNGQADVYSLGAVMCELLTGHPPYPATNLLQLLQLIGEAEPELPRHLSPECRSLLRALLERRARDRLCVDEVGRHPFIAGAERQCERPPQRPPQQPPPQLRRRSSPDDFLQFVECREAFERYDRNGSGGLDTLQVRDALQALGLKASAGEAARVLRRFDASRTGQLELEEFVQCREEVKRFQTRRRSLGDAAAAPAVRAC